MGRIHERLADHKIIGLDTSCLIYHLEANPRYLALTRELLTGVQAGRWTAIVSTVTLMEVCVRPWQLERPAVAREYETLLVNFPNLILADVTRDVARQAAQLRARYRLRPADALLVATALLGRTTVWLTNDHELRRLAHMLDIVVLDDLTLS
jgi:predicted nucleic acid-binding protein